MKKAVIVKLVIIGAACMVIGCGKKEGKEASEEPKTGTDQAQEVRIEDKQYSKTIGQETADAYKLLLTNHTGGEITGLAIKASISQEASSNLLQAGMKIELDETVCVYYTPEAEHPSQTAYDLNLSYADGHVVEIAGIGLDSMEQAELCYEDEIGFVKYKNGTSGEIVSTKEMALALKAQKQAQAAAAEQAQKEQPETQGAEEQTQVPEQAQYDQSGYQPSYDEPTYYQPATQQPAASGGQGSDVGQSGEGCLTDPVTNPDNNSVGQTGEGCLTDPVTNPDNNSVGQTGEGCLTDPVINQDNNSDSNSVGQTGEGCLTDPVLNQGYDSDSN